MRPRFDDVRSTEGSEPDTMTPARSIWQQIEAVHAVVYFASEPAQAAKQAGLRGFWMGYFGFRAAPLGAVGPAAVVVTFANFAPTMVRRSIPDAWDFAEPAVLIAARSASAAAALRRLADGVDEVAAEVNDSLEAAISHGATIGRPLFAANSALDPFDDPVQRLWQNCTTLREHRGDGHVNALSTLGIDGCEAHLLIAAEHGWVPEVFFDNRGWTVDEQRAALEGLRSRNLLDSSGLTSEGARIRADVERLTDSLAWEPYAQAGSEFALDEVTSTLERVSSQIVASGTIPFPNPMGLPRPDGSTAQEQLTETPGPSKDGTAASGALGEVRGVAELRAER